MFKILPLIAFAASILARPADQDPVQFTNTLFAQQDKNPSLAPWSICKSANTLDTSLASNFYWCEIGWQRFIYSPQEVRTMWSKIKEANDSFTTINSRRRDYSVEQFDGISDTAVYYTVEHGAGCRPATARPSDTCLMVAFYRRF